MTWFKLDDQFHSHPKVIVAGNAAVGLYCRLGTYCADKLTDGFVAKAIATSMGTKAELSKLTCCPIPDTRPLLTIVADGYLMADYLQYNPTREQVLEERRKAKERMDKLRGRSPERTANTHPNEQANNTRTNSGHPDGDVASSPKNSHVNRALQLPEQSGGTRTPQHANGDERPGPSPATPSRSGEQQANEQPNLARSSPTPVPVPVPVPNDISTSVDKRVCQSRVTETDPRSITSNLAQLLGEKP